MINEYNLKVYVYLKDPFLVSVKPILIVLVVDCVCLVLAGTANDI